MLRLHAGDDRASLDEALLVSLREGRREMNFADVMEAKFTEEIGLKKAVTYTDNDRRAWPA